jgi:hypothetical protein
LSFPDASGKTLLLISRLSGLLKDKKDKKRQKSAKRKKVICLLKAQSVFLNKSHFTFKDDGKSTCLFKRPMKVRMSF